MDKSWRNIAIALAGLIQSCSLVEQLAKTGYLKSDEFETAVKSLFEQSPDNVESVFGDVKHLHTGAKLLVELIEDPRNPQNSDLIRYVLGALHIQKKLSKRSKVLHLIGARLDKAHTQAEHFGYVHDNLVSNIADIYSDTISKFQYRIQISGEYTYLQQNRVANQVRALLLSAIRAATLWRQMGGRRWHLLFYRSKLADAAKSLLEESKTLH